MSSTTWIAIGIFLFGATGIITLLKMRGGGGRDESHGAVSDQWIAQHRTDRPYDR